MVKRCSCGTELKFLNDEKWVCMNCEKFYTIPADVVPPEELPEHPYTSEVMEAVDIIKGIKKPDGTEKILMVTEDGLKDVNEIISDEDIKKCWTCNNFHGPTKICQNQTYFVAKY